MRIGFRYRRAGMIDRILIPKRAEIARMLAGPPLPPARRPPLPRRAAEALARRAGEPLRLVAEVARRPSARPPVERALAWARAGARMLSVATDSVALGGSFAELAAVRAALDGALGDARPPLLCRDFVLHPVQLDRALDAGADAVLLVARILEPGELAPLADAARARGLEPVVAIADERELAAAALAGARIVGVSARDLNTRRLDPERAEALFESIGAELVAVDLTGDAAAVARAREGRADAALLDDAGAGPIATAPAGP